MKVLVVDDNPHEVRLLRSALEAVSTVELTHVADGREAMALLAKMEPARFDAIVLDWKLTGMQGDQVAKGFLERPDRDLGVPLLFMSSAIPPSIQLDLQERGCMVMTKPMDLEGYDQLALQLAELCAKSPAFHV